VGVFLITFDRNKLESWGFHRWKEEMRRRIESCIIDVSKNLLKVFLVSFLKTCRKNVFLSSNSKGEKVILLQDFLAKSALVFK
jgi:hypothetical protein